jgi:hypothetical protein
MQSAIGRVEQMIVVTYCKAVKGPVAKFRDAHYAGGRVADKQIFWHVLLLTSANSALKQF